MMSRTLSGLTGTAAYTAAIGGRTSSSKNPAKFNPRDPICNDDVFEEHRRLKKNKNNMMGSSMGPVPGAKKRRLAKKKQTE